MMVRTKPLALILAFLPALLCFLYITSSWVNVPYYDEWRIVPLVDGWLHGTLSFADIYAQDDGHRVVIYRLIELLSTSLLRFDSRFEMAIGFLGLCGIAVVLAWKYEKEIENSRIPAVLLTWLAIFLLVFSLRQWENLLGTWAVNNPVSTLFFLTALVFLDRVDWFSFAVAAVSAVLCTFTFSNGLLVWPLGFVYVLLGPARNRWLAWLIATALALAAYAFHYSFFPSPPHLDYMRIVARLFVVLGAPFSFDPGVVSGAKLHWQASLPIAIGVGIGVAVFVASLGLVTVFEKSIARHRFPLAILAYGLGSAAMIAWGRLQFGIEQAVASRYNPVASLVLIGLALLIFEMVFDHPAKKKLVGAMVILAVPVLCATLYGDYREMQVGPYRRAYFEHWRDVVLRYKTATDADLANPHFRPDKIRALAAILDQDHLGPFSKP
jgi:hypothetical protein